MMLENQGEPKKKCPQCGDDVTDGWLLDHDEYDYEAAEAAGHADGYDPHFSYTYDWQMCVSGECDWWEEYGQPWYFNPETLCYDLPAPDLSKQAPEDLDRPF